MTTAGRTIEDEEIEEWEPVLESFLQAIQSKRTVQDLIGVLFAVRLLDYGARGRNEHRWQTDDGFCRYVTLLVELGYEPSAIERELLAEWASDDQEAEANPEPFLPRGRGLRPPASSCLKQFHPLGSFKRAHCTAAGS